ncbi:MAG: hypothetical protein A2X49_01430 [Lentisphaerae bacterium GWF2_52_8]|nr:MAG: hypothetical protein A2X49_01430 [Lentisphaerae bacterium GWF2_52_8]
MIQFEDVHKSLAGAHVLQGLNLSVAHGEIMVIVGHTGSGKSVTLRHIIGLHSPDSGRVLVDGVDLSSLSRGQMEKMRARFGVLFQSAALMNWMNVFDNIALPLRECTKLSASGIKEKVEKALCLLGLENDAMKMPDEISGGMRKRVGIARAIIMEPEILLYDEPTSGLDPVMSRKIDELVLSLNHKLKITSIVVTHDLCSAFGIADRVAMLDAGRVIECGGPEDFKNSKNEYVQNFLAAQFNTSKLRSMEMHNGTHA